MSSPLNHLKLYTTFCSDFDIKHLKCIDRIFNFYFETSSQLLETILFMKL